MAVYLPPQAEKALQAKAEILRIDDDLIIEAPGKPGGKPDKPDKPNKPEPTPQPAEELPWGVGRINADIAWDAATGLAIKVAILDGTSMAAPHVTGVAALVLSVKGPLNPDQMKAHLMDTSEDLGLYDYQQGAGLVRADLATQ